MLSIVIKALACVEVRASFQRLSNLVCDAKHLVNVFLVCRQNLGIQKRTSICDNLMSLLQIIMRCNVTPAIEHDTGQKK